MEIISARNVNYALPQGHELLRAFGHLRESRAGNVLVYNGPVTTVYDNPMERVLLHPHRDANPFFHLFESLWMLAGRNDLPPLTFFVARMAEFSDDGGATQPGAYGFRWREHFNLSGDSFQQTDQIDWAITRLRENPNDRRVVIQMWDAEVDPQAADSDGADVPCNLVALPSINIDGRLDLTVFCRSNDMVWGAYGANAVHFSMLQEYIATALGVPVGKYCQVSNNFHAYTDTIAKASAPWPWTAPAPSAPGQQDVPAPDPYAAGAVHVHPLALGWVTMEAFDGELTHLLADDFADPSLLLTGFLRDVAAPMILAHRAYKADNDFEAAFAHLATMPLGNDWRSAGEMWLHRRLGERAIVATEEEAPAEEEAAPESEE